MKGLNSQMDLITFWSEYFAVHSLLTQCSKVVGANQCSGDLKRFLTIHQDLYENQSLHGKNWVLDENE